MWREPTKCTAKSTNQSVRAVIRQTSQLAIDPPKPKRIQIGHTPFCHVSRGQIQTDLRDTQSIEFL